jgi:DNA-3-methyladenine glycosylase II
VIDQACEHLARDPVMAGIIRTHGPCDLRLRALSPYASLTRAIAHQQLNGRAAETILGRFRALFPGNGRFPAPAAVLAVRPAALRRVGFSRAKVLAIRDIARHARNGTIPTARGCARLTDDELVERLVQIRGVGRWTVEMLLIFTLNRPDVLPVDDFGVREGFKIAYGLKEMPTPKALLAYGERWRPYRSFAARYLWIVANAAKRTREVSARANADPPPPARRSRGAPRGGGRARSGA